MQRGIVHILTLLAILALVILGIFYFSTYSKKLPSFQPFLKEKPLSTQNLPKDFKFALPSFAKQEFKNLSISKSQVKINNVPSLDTVKTKSKVSIIKSVHAQEPSIMPVYKTSYTLEGTQSAIRRAVDFGFDEGISSRKDIRGDLEYFLYWGWFPKDSPTYDEEADRKFRKGQYDIFEINLVDDREGKYSGKPYTRSSLGFHKTPPAAEEAITDQEASEIALKFLKDINLLPPGKLKTVVVSAENHGALGRYDIGKDKVVFVHRTIDDLPVVDGGVSFKPEGSRLEVALKGNTVIGLSYEEFMTQIDFNSKFDLPIKSPQQAIEELLNSKVLAGKVWFNENLGSKFAFEAEINWSENTLKDLAIDDVSIAYYRNENITDEPAGNYYQPIYVFKANGMASGKDFRGEERVNLTFYIPAVIFEKNPTD